MIPGSLLALAISRVGERGRRNTRKEVAMPRARKNFYRRASKRRPPPRSFKATCSRCGKELMMEVPPPEGKDLLCVDCYNK